MSTKELSLIAIEFNDRINNRDLAGLGNLMTEDHTFIDREGDVQKSRAVMAKNWERFFEMFPDFKNTFTEVFGKGESVTIRGYAYWSETQPHDPVSWTATIVDDLVQEWCVHDDTPQNRKLIGLE